MKPVANYRSIMTESDKYKSLRSKKDLVYLICKFLENDNGTQPLKKNLNKLDTNVLYHIWQRNRP